MAFFGKGTPSEMYWYVLRTIGANFGAFVTHVTTIDLRTLTKSRRWTGALTDARVASYGTANFFSTSLKRDEGPSST